MFRLLPRHAAAACVRARFRIPSPFVLVVGDLRPRKNQAGLVHAFAEMVRARLDLPHHLVLAGKETWHGSDIRRAAARSRLAERIHFTGFASDEDLLQLHNGCEFFVLPSFYEGFGLPVLEAMPCARALACSNTSAVHEVADAAAILFDPHSNREITRAMLDLALDAGLRTRMERLELQRAAQFSCTKTAQQTLDVCGQVARTRAPGRQRALSAAG
jgi:glycosyltransferase involved in cell wall biosynthesis